jgi:hypothetical protein
VPSSEGIFINSKPIRYLYALTITALLWLLAITVFAQTVESPKIYAIPESPIIYSHSYISSESSILSVKKDYLKSTVLDMVEKAGYSRYVADKVIQCESGWNPNAIGDVNNGGSYGLWQIHQPAHNTGDKAFDPIWATEYAIKLLDKHGWRPWTCYKNLF